MPQLTVTERTAISDVISQLIRNSRSPGELTAGETARLGEALITIGETFPEVALTCLNYVPYTARTLAAHDVKSGKSGTWDQITKGHAADIEQMLEAKQT